MSKLIEQLRLRSLVKESFDNLPSGVCFFSQEGLVVLCNYQMSRLIFAMTGHDIQSLEELQHILSSAKTVKGVPQVDSNFLLPDGTGWNFTTRQIKDNKGISYTEVIAVEVSELRKKQKLLIEANQAKRQTIASLEQIQKNVVAITREEEILAMKMRLHQEFGYNLQTIRKYFQSNCPQQEKMEFLTRQRKMLGKMQGELDNDDDIDSLKEIQQLAKALDMQIIISGEKPKQAEVKELLSHVIRECLTNTIRHAEGNIMFVKLTYDANILTAVITNNGKQPNKEIIEGGGLTSLRKRIENANGTMVVSGVPKFSLTVTILMKGDNIL